MKIRILTLFLLIGLSLFANCNSDDILEVEFESTAIISGYDMALCPCCGGWIINIDEQEFEKRFNDLPESSNIDLENAIFPVSVNLNWSELDTYCGYGIQIDAIELVE